MFQALLDLATQPPYGFVVELHSNTKMPVMFENDPGSVEVRSTVKCYTIRKAPASQQDKTT